MEINTCKVAELMTAKLWTREDLAVAAGVSWQTVGAMLRYGRVGRRSAQLIAEALGVQIGEIERQGDYAS